MYVISEASASELNLQLVGAVLLPSWHLCIHQLPVIDPSAPSGGLVATEPGGIQEVCI